MIKFKKPFCIKIISILISIIFLCNTSLYSYPLSGNSLRVSVGQKQTRDRIKDVIEQRADIDPTIPIELRSKIVKASKKVYDKLVDDILDKGKDFYEVENELNVFWEDLKAKGVAGIDIRGLHWRFIIQNLDGSIDIPFTVVVDGKKRCIVCNLKKERKGLYLKKIKMYQFTFYQWWTQIKRGLLSRFGLRSPDINLSVGGTFFKYLCTHVGVAILYLLPTNLFSQKELNVGLIRTRKWFEKLLFAVSDDIHSGIPTVYKPFPTGTLKWAQEVGFEKDHAWRLAWSCGMVDKDSYPLRFLIYRLRISHRGIDEYSFVKRVVGKHFNISRGNGDSRLELAYARFKNAIRIAKSKGIFHKRALWELGAGLHALQDLCEHYDELADAHSIKAHEFSNVEVIITDEKEKDREPKSLYLYGFTRLGYTEAITKEYLKAYLLEVGTKSTTPKQPHRDSLDIDSTPWETVAGRFRKAIKSEFDLAIPNSL